MGGGVTAWFTPGWTQYEPRYAPHIAAPAGIKAMLDAGEDPKPMVLEECKP